MGRQRGTRCIQGKNKGMLHYLLMLQEWRKTTFKGLSSSIAGYAKTAFTVFSFLPSRLASVQHFKGLASNPSLWQQHHCAPKNEVPFHESIINFVSILWISMPINLFTSIFHQTTAAALILGGEPHGSRCWPPFLPPPCALVHRQSWGSWGKVPPRHEAELFALQPDKQEGPINWISCT